jgi:DNA-directed RNA polymerase specialized sigma54-like protein
VVPSDWKVIDWDQDPDVDACVFYRQAREGETFQGFKIQGIGHDGQQSSKQKAVRELVELLNKTGYWIESSDAMRATLRKLSAPTVDDVEVLQQLFQDPQLTMVDDITYRRHLQSGQAIVETVFGRPVLAK